MRFQGQLASPRMRKKSCSQVHRITLTTTMCSGLLWCIETCSTACYSILNSPSDPELRSSAPCHSTGRDHDSVASAPIAMTSSAIIKQCQRYGVAMSSYVWLAVFRCLQLVLGAKLSFPCRYMQVLHLVVISCTSCEKKAAGIQKIPDTREGICQERRHVVAWGADF